VSRAVGDGAGHRRLRKRGQAEIQFDAALVGDLDGAQLLLLVAEGRRGDGVAADREVDDDGAVCLGGQGALDRPDETYVDSSQPLAGVCVGGGAGDLTDRTGRCRVDQCQRVEPALAVHVVVGGGATTLGIGRVDG
jgi:hypothetical protein